MKLILQAIRSLFNKIELALHEQVKKTEENTKKLAKLRGQNLLILDLATGECNVPFSTVAKMEPAEIQASLRLIGQEDTDAVPHELSAFAVNKSFIEYNGESFCTVHFFVATGLNHDYSGIPEPDFGLGLVYHYTWEAGGLKRDSEAFRLAFAEKSEATVPVPDGASTKTRSLFCYMEDGESSACFRRLDLIPLDGIVLKSRGSSSYNFLVTVDDNGSLSTQKVTGLD